MAMLPYVAIQGSYRLVFLSAEQQIFPSAHSFHLPRLNITNAPSTLVGNTEPVSVYGLGNDSDYLACAKTSLSVTIGQDVHVKVTDTDLSYTVRPASRLCLT